METTVSKAAQLLKPRVTASSISAAHAQHLIEEIKVNSVATLLAGEVSVVTIKAIEGVVDELKEFISTHKSVTKADGYLFAGLLNEFLIEKARQDGIIIIAR